jgi:hypothetical protein
LTFGIKQGYNRGRKLCLITITGGSFIKPNQQCNERTALRTERGQSICKDALTPFCFLSAAERQKRKEEKSKKEQKR